MAYDPLTALIVVDVQNDFADPAGSLVGRRRRGGRRCRQHAGRRRRFQPARWSSTRRTGIRRRRPTSPRTAASGRSIAWPTPGARRCTPASRSSGQSSTRASAAKTATRASRCRDPRTGLTSPTELEVILQRAPDRTRGGRSDWPPTTASWRPSSTRCALGFETTVVRDAIAAVDLQPGDGERALATMAEAGARVA